jgi:3',5'-cyclic AMP phosphodiesterase CpdA
VVITGDIAANAEKRDLRLARTLLKGYGLLDSHALSVVIGNHDIFGGVHHPEDIFTFPKSCRQTNYKGKVRNFCESFRESFDRCLFESESSMFPYAKVLGDLVLVGINSVAEYSKLGNPFGSNGEVSDREFEQTGKILNSPMLRGRRKIVLIHHHFCTYAPQEGGGLNSIWNSVEGQTMKLRGKKKLLELFKAAGVELVLHGHLHENREYERNGVRIVNGGGSVLAAKGEARLNLITIGDGFINVEEDVVRFGSRAYSPPLAPSMPGVAA